jgi:hypothetical protein
MDENKDHDSIVELKTIMTDVKSDVHDIHKLLFGNGQEGLCYMVQRHKTYFRIFVGVLVVIVPIIAAIVWDLIF